MFIPLPPFDTDSEDDLQMQPARKVSRKNAPEKVTPSSSDMDIDIPPPILHLHSARHLTLTTDHNPYNKAEANAVLRRCNNAPKAISSKQINNS
jgi:hypothetical protein